MTGRWTCQAASPLRCPLCHLMLLWASSGAVFELSITEFATFRDGQHKAASVTVVLNSGPVFSARFSVSGPPFPPGSCLISSSHRRLVMLR